MLVVILAVLAAPLAAQRACHTELCETPVHDNVLLQSRKVLSRDEQNMIAVMSWRPNHPSPGPIEDIAALIRQKRPAVVGVRTCEDRQSLADLAKYTPVETETHMYDQCILFDSGKVELVSSGRMIITNRTNETPLRAIIWGTFLLGTKEFYFFNTYVTGLCASLCPNPDNYLPSLREIASKLLAKRRQLGAEDMPTIVVGEGMTYVADEMNKVQPGSWVAGTLWKRDGILYSAADWTHDDNFADSRWEGERFIPYNHTCNLTLTR